MNVTLGGHPLEPTITMRLEDFQAAIAAAATAARESFIAPEMPSPVENQPSGVICQAVVPSGIVVDAPKPAKKGATTKKAPTKHATEAQRPAPVAQPGEYTPSRGSIPDLVLSALGKAPASSLELTTLIGLDKSGAIYQAVKFLREKGLVEGFEDENDGAKRWRLCGK